MCDALRIPQSGHLTVLEMAKVYVISNCADSVVGIQKGDGWLFHHDVNKNSGTQYPMKTKGFSSNKHDKSMKLPSYLHRLPRFNIGEGFELAQSV